MFKEKYVKSKKTNDIDSIEDESWGTIVCIDTGQDSIRT